MYCLSNMCSICLNNEDINSYIIFQDAENELVQQVKFVLPEIAILGQRLPLPVCSTCRQALATFHKFKKMCLDNNCRYNDYLNKLQVPNASSKREFDVLEVKINENKLLSDLEEEGNIDSNVAELEEEDNLVEDAIDIKDMLGFSVSENSFYVQILKNEIESSNVQYCYENINSVDQIIKDENRSCDEEFRISENKLLTIANTEGNINLNIEELETAENLFENASEESIGQLYQQIINDETDSNNGQDFERMIDRVNQITKRKMNTSEQEAFKNMCQVTDVKCPICNEIIDEESTLVRHVMRVHSNVKEIKCLICGKIFQCDSSLRGHMKGHAGLKGYKCLICNRMFTHNLNLKKHMKVHTDVKDYKCSICNKIFSHSTKLKYHMVTHTRKTNYECSVCNDMFASKSKLKYHMVTHTREKNYECSVCNKMFSSKSSVRYHRLLHAGVKDYKCSICNRMFSTNSELNRHMFSHTVSTRYKCIIKRLV